MIRRQALLSICASLFGGMAILAADDQPLRLIHTVPLPGIKGRFDHFACSAASKRLIVAALGNDTVEVIDTAAFKRVRTIKGLHMPTGVLAKDGRFYVANGEDGSFRAFDENSEEEVARLRGLDDADNTRFEPAEKQVYVGYGDGALAVTDLAVSKLLSSIPLPGHPEAFELEKSGSRIFVNVPEARQIAVVDRKEHRVVANWQMEKWKANFPMSLDEEGQRLFVGCRNPSRLVVFDTKAGKLVADVELSGDTDDLFFDAKRQRIYASCGAGFLDVVQRSGGDRFERIARIPTRAGARTCFFSPELDSLFLAVPARDGHEAELRVYKPE